jgi:hypothetical protein
MIDADMGSEIPSMAKGENNPIDPAGNGPIAPQGREGCTITRPPSGQDLETSPNQSRLTPVGGDALNAIQPTEAPTRPNVRFLTVYTADMLKPIWPEPLNTTHPNRYVTPAVFAAILNNIINCGVYYKACVAAGISMRYLNKITQAFPVLKEIVEDARAIYCDRVAEAIHNRAVNGWDEPVFYQGEQVGEITKYSDRLLELLAKRHIPEFRDHTTSDVNVSGGVLVVHEPAVDKAKWLEERRKADAIEGTVVKPAEDVHDTTK